MKTSRRGFFKFPAAASAAEVVPGLPKPKAKGFGLAPLKHESWSLVDSDAWYLVTNKTKALAASMKRTKESVVNKVFNEAFGREYKRRMDEHGGLLGTGAEVSDKSLGGPVRQRYEEEVEQGIRTADPGKIGHG
jgi:hypothetical protein|tara:strand:+ start:999 stop:1400 length:402 start_codon:yes stop_codon:yes gene_type:complete